MINTIVSSLETNTNKGTPIWVSWFGPIFLLFTSITFVPGLEKWLLLTEILNMFRVELRAILVVVNC